MQNITPTRTLMLIITVLLITGFFESGRLIRFLPSETGNIIDRAALQFAKISEFAKMEVQRLFGWDIHGIVQYPIESASPEIISGDSGLFMLPPVPRFIPLSPPYNILILGDSFIAERIGPELEKTLSDFQNVSVSRVGIYSTGLTRPDYFNWNVKIKELIDAHAPNVAIIMFGANDAQNTYDDAGSAVLYGTAAWDNLYSVRIRAILDTLRANNVTVFWIGIPIPRSETYRERMNHLNTLYENSVMTLKQAIFIPTWNTLADTNGEYTEYLPDEKGIERRIRASDGIHPTAFGAEIVARAIIEELRKHLTLIEKSATAQSEKHSPLKVQVEL